MLTCRDIPPEKWEEARKALVFYFSRRHGLENAQDLAQETLAVLLSRDDYKFESASDFLRVCRAFASRILLAAYRESAKHAGGGLDVDLVPAPELNAFGLNPVEMGICFRQVVEAAESGLRPNELLILQHSEVSDRSAAAKRLGLGDANNFGVHLYRIRKKLARITGWKK